MKFVIEQVAIAPRDAGAARQLLADMGAAEWSEDRVAADGRVFGAPRCNVAELAFKYELLAVREFEVLNYVAGDSWLGDNTQGSVSPFGMHCSVANSFRCREFFAAVKLPVAQEVMTRSHTNPHIAGERWYNYVIFNTKALLGVDLTFIVRLHSPGLPASSLSSTPKRPASRCTPTPPSPSNRA